MADDLRKGIDSLAKENERLDREESSGSSFSGPTKRNHAGYQQPYVPSGHGDESGEYRDNAYGGFGGETSSGANYDLPKIEKPKDKPNETPNIEVSKGNQSNGKDFNDYVMNMYGDGEQLGEFGQALVNNFNTGTNDAKGLVNILVKVGVKVKKADGISNYSGAVNLSGISKFGEYSSKVIGETFYHEFWHAADNCFCEGTVDDDGKTTIKSLRTEEDTRHIADSIGGGWKALVEGALYTRELSTCKVLSNGMTLYETIQKEGRNLSRHTGEDRYTNYWDVMKREYKKEIEDELNKLYPTDQKEVDRYNEYLGNLKREAEKVYPLWVDNHYDNDGFEKRDKYVKNKLAESEFANLDTQLRNKDKARSKLETQALRHWSSLSDIYGLYKKVPYGFASCGHTGSYAKQKGSLAHEFMAEFGSARSRTDEDAKKEMALFQKWFPESSKMCAELQDMIISHYKKGGKE